MATSQSGKRKLIPHAQKDGSSAWKEREEEEEIQRDEGSRIEPDEVKETPPPPLSFTTLFSTLHLSTNRRFTTTSKETIESVFQGGREEGLQASRNSRWKDSSGQD